MLDRYHSERTGTDYEDQSATMFIIPNHGSEVLNGRDQRVFFSLEVARYLIDHAKGKKNPLAPRVVPGRHLLSSAKTLYHVFLSNDNINFHI